MSHTRKSDPEPCNLFEDKSGTKIAEIHNADLKAEKNVLRSLYPNWDAKPEAVRMNDLRSLQQTIGALITTGFNVDYPEAHS